MKKLDLNCFCCEIENCKFEAIAIIYLKEQKKYIFVCERHLKNEDSKKENIKF